MLLKRCFKNDLLICLDKKRTQDKKRKHDKTKYGVLRFTSLGIRNTPEVIKWDRSEQRKDKSYENGSLTFLSSLRT